MEKPIPFGKYYLLDRISVGKATEVYKAKAYGNEGFERLIAVKRIIPGRTTTEDSITRFIDEAKIGVQLQHPNIAQTFDLGRVGDSYFIALEYVHGRDLRAVIDRLNERKSILPISAAVFITMKVCEGLDFAHNKKDSAGRALQFVHRKINPKTILVSYDGEVKIVNLGLVKADGKAERSQAGIIKGKMGYMSPEQASAFPIDNRSDIFTVGICLWEMLTGERLFVAESEHSVLDKIRNAEIIRPSVFNSDIPYALEKIVFKALSREARDRYQDAVDLHDDLQRWVYNSGTFFARKALETLMHEWFREEIAEASTDMADHLIL